jgi:hypothetical protein
VPQSVLKFVCASAPAPSCLRHPQNALAHLQLFALQTELGNRVIDGDFVLAGPAGGAGGAGPAHVLNVVRSERFG